MIILGIDPGKTTGAVVLDTETMKTTWDAMLTLEGTRKVFPSFIPEMDMIAIERYTISLRTVKKTRQPDALEIIGMVKYLVWRWGKTLHVQTPADAKTAFPDKVLHRLDLWHGSVHVRDATRHALLAARRSGHDVHFDV